MKKGYFFTLVTAVLSIAIASYSMNYLQSTAQPVKSPVVAKIELPEGSWEIESGKNFEPRVITVVLGVNNTVQWVNSDFGLTFIEADNESDPAFYAVTEIKQDARLTDVSLPNVLKTGESFEYTFTTPGEFGYHGKPWQRGTVVVLDLGVGAK